MVVSTGDHFGGRPRRIASVSMNMALQVGQRHAPDRRPSGCIAVGDRAIEQLYLVALDSAAAGREVLVQVFPCRFSSPACARRLAALSRRKPSLAEFWANLREGFEAFARAGVPPAVTVDASGRYRFAPENETMRYRVPQ